MNTYSLILFLHFVGMVGLFVGYGLEWAASALLPRSTTADQARSWLRIYRASLPISGPGLLLLIGTGGYMAARSGVSSSGWVIATLGAIVVALAIGFGLVLPRVKAIRTALPEGNAPLSPDALTRVRNPMIPTVIRARAFLALGIVYVMTFRPDLAPSCFILAGALILGALFAAPAWASRKTA